MHQDPFYSIHFLSLSLHGIIHNATQPPTSKPNNAFIVKHLEEILITQKTPKWINFSLTHDMYFLGGAGGSGAWGSTPQIWSR